MWGLTTGVRRPMWGLTTGVRRPTSHFPPGSIDPCGVSDYVVCTIVGSRCLVFPDTSRHHFLFPQVRGVLRCLAPAKTPLAFPQVRVGVWCLAPPYIENKSSISPSAARVTQAAWDLTGKTPGAGIVLYLATKPASSTPTRVLRCGVSLTKKGLERLSSSVHGSDDCVQDE